MGDTVPLGGDVGEIEQLVIKCCVLREGRNRAVGDTVFCAT